MQIDDRKRDEIKIDVKNIYTKIYTRHTRIILSLIYKLHVNSTGQTICPISLWNSFEREILKITTNIALGITKISSYLLKQLLITAARRTNLIICETNW